MPIRIRAAPADETLRIGLVGCGGRGTGAAAQALAADPNVKLVALGDAFSDRLNLSLETLKKQEKVPARVDVPEARQFVGFDAYRKVIELSDVVLLATPPHFRPMHMQAAIAAGKHVFAEKPIAAVRHQPTAIKSRLPAVRAFDSFEDARNVAHAALLVVRQEPYSKTTLNPTLISSPAG
ncbi:MAG: hypothetical protein FJ403_18280 [Verrucomicrobia bacterium]|nr:hypothetical protein [Verrucomicrobiota bacterium]